MILGSSNRVIFSSAPDQEAIARAKSAALDENRMVGAGGLRSNAAALSAAQSAGIEKMFAEGDDPLAKKAGEKSSDLFKRRRSTLGALRRGI
jgi:glutamate 5-kinase